METLRRGGIVLHPTDTVYGLACDAFNEKALNKMDQIKGGRPGKSFLVLVDSVKTLKKLVEEIPHLLEDKLDFFTARPLTGIFKAVKNWPFITKEGKIAVRIPSMDFLLEVLRAFGSPIASTSANPTGQQLSSFKEIEAFFSGKVDLIIEGPTGGELPSTIVDFTLFPPKILREGAVKEEELREILGLE